MAKKPPKAPIQSGAETGRLSANRSPVTTAEKSPIVIGFFTNNSNPSSVSTQAATVIKMCANALGPKL